MSFQIEQYTFIFRSGGVVVMEGGDYVGWFETTDDALIALDLYEV